MWSDVVLMDIARTDVRFCGFNLGGYCEMKRELINHINLDRNMVEWYDYIIPIVSLITAGVALITVYYLKKQFKQTENAYNSSKKVAEINAALQIQQVFNMDPGLKQVRLSISSKGPILNEDGGSVPYEDFATYLDFVNRLPYYSNMEVIGVESLLDMFQGVIVELANNPFAQSYIRKQGEKEGQGYSGIEKMMEWTKKRHPKYFN